MHGPDANGSYGGLGGLGGLEAVYSHPSVNLLAGSWTGIIDDYYGHVVAYVDGETVTESSLHWQRTRCIGYGPAPDSPVFYVSEGAPLIQATAWRGKRQDITGFYWLGARYYEPTSGRFRSADPLGHAASLSLYDYAGGDPVNFVDPNGRSPSPQMDTGAMVETEKRFPTLYTPYSLRNTSPSKNKEFPYGLDPIINLYHYMSAFGETSDYVSDRALAGIMDTSYVDNYITGQSANLTRYIKDDNISQDFYKIPAQGMKKTHTWPVRDKITAYQILLIHRIVHLPIQLAQD